MKDNKAGGIIQRWDEDRPIMVLETMDRLLGILQENRETSSKLRMDKDEDKNDSITNIHKNLKILREDWMAMYKLFNRAY